jgi:hypothetical protein
MEAAGREPSADRSARPAAEGKRAAPPYLRGARVRGISFHVFGFGGDIRRYELPRRFMALTPRLPASDEAQSKEHADG